MNAVRHGERLSRDQVADLLFRYPRVSDAETKLILGFLRNGRHLDIGLLTADEALKPHLDSFMADHAKHFRVGAVEGSVVVAAIVGVLFFCLIVFETMTPAAG